MTFYVSSELSHFICIEMGDSRKSSKLFTLFPEKIGGTNRASFQGVCVDDCAILEDLVQVNICLRDVYFVDGAMVGELARRSVGKHSNTVWLLVYNCALCFVIDVNVLLKLIDARRLILSLTEH